ncbi:MAG: Jag N-terminal domain-containing protein, partial [Deltaproteobacteria bacterium]|nr:Jag N-terminal domain-containing protein [Deltaproteobacteria bacterium]
MDIFEFEGKTTEEAIENACRQLNLKKDDVDIEIIEPGSAGIFGLVGGRKAKIKVSTTKEVNEIPDQINGLAVAKEALENILALIPVEGITVQAEQIDGTIALNIEGDTSGLLIGRKGRTLDALQFIVNKIVNKTLEKRVQVVVDSENYRER